MKHDYDSTYYLNVSFCARNVQQIYATQFAFAAILADGRVVSWGDPASGGDSSGVQDRLRQGENLTGQQKHGVKSMLFDEDMFKSKVWQVVVIQRCCVKI